MKILFVSNVRSHIGQFHTNFINLLVKNGHTVDVSCFDNSADKDGYDFEAINKFHFIPLQRSPFKMDNIKAISELKEIIKAEQYDIIHCHTPMGAVAARVAAKQAKSKAKIIYTAHGFHFFKGASKLNWMFFYPVEKILAHYTDTLVTINNEDYELATKKKFKVKNEIVKINGVGVDLSKFIVATNEMKTELRKEYGYNEDEFLLIYPADYSYRKNHEMLFDTVYKLKDKIPTIKVLMPGQQKKLEEYKKYVADLGIEKHISMLGYRRDIHKLITLSDISVSTSRQEGLPVNLIEALAIGKPIVATNVRGNSDLVENGVNGFLVELNNSDQMAEKILEIYNNSQLAEKMRKEAVKMSKKYSFQNVNKSLVEIYQKYGVNFSTIE
ncbi:MAG: glycosyltransferase family 4 protein [Acutalibacteraceae bacterium]|nr:glycosyltransferase family 4 protein [Acutalibacteraceae bacterium]